MDKLLGPFHKNNTNWLTLLDQQSSWCNTFQPVTCNL